MPSIRDKPHIDMRAMQKYGEQQVTKILIRAGFKLARDIKRSMGRTSGGESRQGKVRATKAARKKGRFDKRVSAPGDPPFVQLGRLRASISVNWRDRSIGFGGTNGGGSHGKVGSAAFVTDGIPPPSRFAVVTVGTNVEYAAALEFGTATMAKRPFIGPALGRLTIP